MSKNKPKNEIPDVIKILQGLEDFVSSQNGRTVQLGKEQTFTQPYLHQGAENMTEEESVQSERDDPELFRFMQSFDKEIEDAIKKLMKG